MASLLSQQGDIDNLPKIVDTLNELIHLANSIKVEVLHKGVFTIPPQVVYVFWHE